MWTPWPRLLGRAVLGTTIVGTAAVCLWQSGSLAAQRQGRAGPPTAGGAAGPLWTMATPLEDGRQLLLVLDQEQRAVAVYHVDPASGTLTLKSTRDIRWDLLVGDFNAQDPKPAALQKMLEMPK